MKRLFAALTLESTVKSRLTPIYKELTRYSSQLKVVPPENYHLTVKFLGNLDDRNAENVITGFTNLKTGVPEIPVQIKGLGVFPRLLNAAVIWLGIDGNRESLAELNRIVQDFFFELGFDKDERKFKPHLTIARVRKGKKLNNTLINYIEENRDSEFEKTSFGRIVLYESELKEDGPVYSEVSSIFLK